MQRSSISLLQARLAEVDRERSLILDLLDAEQMLADQARMLDETRKQRDDALARPAGGTATQQAE